MCIKPLISLQIHIVRTSTDWDVKAHCRHVYPTSLNSVARLNKTSPKRESTLLAQFDCTITYLIPQFCYQCRIFLYSRQMSKKPVTSLQIRVVQTRPIETSRCAVGMCTLPFFLPRPGLTKHHRKREISLSPNWLHNNLPTAESVRSAVKPQRKIWEWFFKTAGAYILSYTTEEHGTLKP